MSELLPVDARVLSVDGTSPDPAAIEAAAEVIRRGGLVAFPTETVYGLGADAANPQAVAKIFAAKRRPFSDPLIVHIADATALAAVAARVPPLADELAAAFWPGPLTLVLPRSDRMPLVVSAGLDTVAVRLPSHPVARALIRAAGRPIAAPSANLFSRPSPTEARHVLQDLAGRVDLILDGGPAAVGLESTVVDLAADPPAILRPGGLTLEALRAVAPRISYAPRHAAPGEVVSSPGMLLKHYSPRAEVCLFTGPRAAALDAMRAKIAVLASQGRRPGILALHEDAECFASEPAALVLLGPAHDLAEVGRNLFGALRALDEEGADVILVRAPSRESLGEAIWDRLYRAAEGRVVEAT